MKILKWLLIVLLILAGLVLIVPAFLPATTIISAEADIAVGPDEVFHSAALYLNRDQWDPWLQMEPEAKVTIEPKEGYIGSTYSWEGDKIGYGMMKVEKVVFGKEIQSTIWFGEDPDSSLVEWHLEKTDEGTHVTWNFVADGKYPFGRLMMMMMSGGMQNSFESGLASMKEIIEADPPKLYKTGEIQVGMMKKMHTLVIPMEGTMEEMSQQMGNMFKMLFGEVAKQGLQMAGTAFSYYIDFDEETGYAHALLGLQIAEPGKASGDIKSKTFKEQEVVMLPHYGKYDYLKDSYETLTKYTEENGMKLTGGAFELYKTTMMESDNPMDWLTVIAFPLK